MQISVIDPGDEHADGILAMKVRAGRYDRDLQDIWILCQVLELVRLEQVWDIVDEVWGAGMLREDVDIGPHNWLATG